MSFEGKKIEERAKTILSALRSIQIESGKFGESLRVLTKHINDTKNTSDMVNTRYGSLNSKISTIATLEQKEDEKLTIPEEA